MPIASKGVGFPDPLSGTLNDMGCEDSAGLAIIDFKACHNDAKLRTDLTFADESSCWGH